MTRMANEYERADRYRDHMKHEPRPGDRNFTDNDVLGKFNGDPLPLHIQAPPIQGSLEIAILAQAVPLIQAAELIERYVRAECAAARLDATATAIDCCCAEIEKQGGKVDA
jgi:hypothetical protein